MASNKKSLDLLKLLPTRYRDKTLDTLVENLFNKHVSKLDVETLFGFIGDKLSLEPGEVQIEEDSLERQINQLTPLIYTKHASEEIVSSWPEILQKLILLGVDYNTISDWLKSKSYNFLPPIDLDKFCNFNEYFWIGSWIQSAPGLPYNELGIPNLSNITPIFNKSNENYLPEYYLIARGELDGSYDPIPPLPDLTTWSDWSLCNLWIHKEDVISFLSNHPGVISFDSLTQASRPIIEYFINIKLNSYQTSNGIPSDSGIYKLVEKFYVNQPPLFDLYLQDESHAGFTSSIFFYTEGSQYPLDSVINRRIAVDENNDFIFQQSLVNTNTNKLYFYKLYDGVNFNIKTIWYEGDETYPKYVKYDVSGTLINQDKFINFKNYFWVGNIKNESELPVYNSIGLPEYSVIESGGTSDWSIYNFWIHVSQLKNKDLKKYIKAEKPIIEFNLNLEAELINTKTFINELPKFKLYTFDQVTDDYLLIPDISDPNLNSAYSNNTILARLDDLPYSKDSVLTTPEILDLTFTSNNEIFLQGLDSGKFVDEKDGILYGYIGRIVNYDGVGNGSLINISVDSVCLPELIILTFDSGSNSFIVNGTVSGTNINANLNTNYNISGLNFTPIAGSTLFEDGDQFILEIKSYVFESKNLFVKLNGAYRTINSPNEFLIEEQNNNIIEATPSLRDGTWEVPPQMIWNVENETRQQVNQGDLYFHFISIIEAQPELIGSSTGKNNWRNLTSKDFGLGGKIKQYDGDFHLLLSMLLQEDISYLSLIDFARESYEKLFNSIKVFITDKVPDLLTSRSFIPPLSGDEIDQNLVEEFKNYFNQTSSITQATATTADDHLSTLYYDSTSSLDNLVVTLPYIGLCDLIEPKKELDLELNFDVLIHHDGHKSRLTTISQEILKQIVVKSFKRSSGQESPGVITGFNFPPKPFKGQFWYKTGSGQLFVYNVVSDTGEFPIDALIGDYSYNRLTNEVYQFNGAWNYIGNGEVTVAQPWLEVKLDLIEQNLTLAIEQYLYKNCPTLIPRLNTVALESNPLFSSNLQEELEKFGIKYGTTDVYSSVYDSTNAFTWNYNGVLALGASSTHATWQEIYKDVYDTSRPDLQPWIPAGYASELDFINDLILASLIPPTSTEFDISMWSSIGSFVSNKYVLAGRPSVLSVDTSNGSLLAPYNSIDSLVTIIPSTASQSFNFGDLGPIELYWTRTLDYLYSKQKIYYKLDPLTYTRETWGIKNSLVGDYTINSLLGHKQSQSDIILHGDLLDDLSQKSWFNISSNGAPLEDITYEVSFVSRLDGIFKITGDGLSEPVFIYGNSYSDSYISITLNPGIRDFFWGDTINITVSSDGSIIYDFIPQKYFKAEGFNQIYVQYNRTYGQDLSVSLNLDLLKNWILKLGYRFNSLVNTDFLTLKSNSSLLADSSYNVLLKENKFVNSSWLNALRIQVARKGSSTRINGVSVPAVGTSGVPGDDWIFRIDNFNEKRTSISWEQLDTSDEYDTFIALDGRKTLFPWKKYKKSLGTLSFKAPFLITGLQNLINFIFGFSYKLDKDGWRFNDQENPVLDPITNKPISYQLLIEQFIAQIFSGIDAGAFLILNPFERKVWYKTPIGTVSNIHEVLGLEQETTCAILDQQRKRILPSQIRVFRQNDITEIVSDQPIYTLHLLTSTYEHVILFDNYAVDTALIYDSFLGQKIDRIFLNSERQATKTGRVDLGGHFLLNNELKRNIESSISGILKMYDTVGSSIELPEVQQARSLLGFSKKNYFENRGSTDSTEFRFWQGMISNKGTNLAVDAYINSLKYKTAKIDEYWAYKLAEYGDARIITKAELKVSLEDCNTERTNYLFIENNNFGKINEFGIETFDSSGTIEILPTDEDRWFSFEDLGVQQYFEADIRFEQLIEPTEVGQIFIFKDSKGNLINVDCFELISIDQPPTDDSQYGLDLLPYDTGPLDSTLRQSYYEIGDYIIGTNPAEYEPPKFTRINSYTIRIDSEEILNRTLKVIGYGPSFKLYNPSNLYDYRKNILIKDDLIWWDPARDIHQPEAISSVTFKSLRDPAIYNQSELLIKTPENNKLKPWGEKQVGKIWWNLDKLEWLPYHDTKIYPDLQDRLGRWGSLADFSKIKIFEWIKSNLSPEDFEQTTSDQGELAVKKVVERSRTWYQRPIAWKFSSNPKFNDRAFLTYQPTKIKINDNGDGFGSLILKEKSFDSLLIKTNTKIAGVIYSSTTKTDNNIDRIFGTAKILADVPNIIIGTSSGFDDGAGIDSSIYMNISIEIDEESKTFNSNLLGQYIFSNEYDSINNKRFLILTQFSSGLNQKIEIKDSSITANILDSYTFDKFGLIINYTILYGHSDSWPSFGTTTEDQRKEIIATALGNINHDLVLRSSIPVQINIPFIDNSIIYNTLDSNLDITTNGWIAWNDPDINPLTSFKPPYNQYEPLAGDWIEIGNYLLQLKDDITSKLSDPWIWFDDISYVPYKFIWTNWSERLDTNIGVIYNPVLLTQSQFMQNNFTLDNETEQTLSNRIKVYKNNKLLKMTDWEFDTTSTLYINILNPNIGDKLRVIVDLIKPTTKELEFDPIENDSDPLILSQVKYDYPCVVETLRDSFDQLTIVNYYYWVTNKLTVENNKLSTVNIENLLRSHGSVYEIPQVLRYYNQLDGRPNRYGLLSIKNFGNLINAENTYKLRLLKDPTLEIDNNSTSIKNVHTEWILLRPFSPSLPPKELWDLLTDTLIGENLIGQTLPFTILSDYDDRHDTSVQYGFDEGKVLDSIKDSREIFKYTILNTKVTTFVNEELIPDYINYSGFDLNNLDSYFNTSEDIRKFMSDLWRFAKPKQINELFFAVLIDAASKNLTLTKFFKTSLISLNEVRTFGDN